MLARHADVRFCIFSAPFAEKKDWLVSVTLMISPFTLQCPQTWLAAEHSALTSMAINLHLVGDFPASHVWFPGVIVFHSFPLFAANTGHTLSHWTRFTQRLANDAQPFVRARSILHVFTFQTSWNNNYIKYIYIYNHHQIIQQHGWFMEVISFHVPLGYVNMIRSFFS